MSLAEMLLRTKSTQSLHEVVALRTARQIAEIDDESLSESRYVCNIIDSANEVYWMYRADIEAISRETLTKVLDDIVEIERQEISAQIDGITQRRIPAHYHSLAINMMYTLNSLESHSRASYVYTVRELIMGTCERNNLPYPNKTLIGGCTGTLYYGSWNPAPSSSSLIN